MPMSKLRYNVEDLKLIFDIQMVGRLVQNQKFRLLRQHSGEDHTLLLPAGQRYVITVRMSGQMYLFQRLLHDFMIPYITVSSSFLWGVRPIITVSHTVKSKLDSLNCPTTPICRDTTLGLDFRMSVSSRNTLPCCGLITL